MYFSKTTCRSNLIITWTNFSLVKMRNIIILLHFSNNKSCCSDNQKVLYSPVVGTITRDSPCGAIHECIDVIKGQSRTVFSHVTFVEHSCNVIEYDINICSTFSLHPRYTDDGVLYWLECLSYNLLSFWFKTQPGPRFS